MKQSKILDAVAEVKIRLNSGITHVGFIKNSIYVGAGLTIMFKLSSFQAVVATLLAMIGFFVLGCLDLDLVKLAQKEAELSTGKYNPFFKKTLGKSSQRGRP